MAILSWLLQKPAVPGPGLVLIAVTACLALMPGTAASAAQSAPAPRPPEPDTVTDAGATTMASQSRFRGSAVTYRTAVSAVSLDRGADLTYDPYVEMGVGLQPRWWLGETVYLSGSMEILGELTHSNVRNDRVYASDLQLQVGADQIVEIPGLAIGVCGAAGVSLPTSRPSRAESQLLLGEASICLARKLGLVTLRYTLRGSKSWHRYTTGVALAEYVEPDGGPMYFGDVEPTYRGLGRDVAGGVRNVSWGLGNGLTASLSPTDGLSLSVTAGVATLFLYPYEAAAAHESEHSAGINDPVDRRDTAYFNAAVTYTPVPLVAASLAVSTFNAQLQPDGRYRRFGLNRLTQVGLNLSMDVAELLSL